MLQETLAILFLFTEISSTTLSTLFVKEDDRFSYSCRHNLTWKADWRFKALGENTAIYVNREFTNKNALFIPDVQPTNAGKYSYWSETSTGQQQRVCSVTLCVLSGKFISSNQATFIKYFRYSQLQIIHAILNKLNQYG